MTETEQREYRKAIISYVDILGFSEIIRESVSRPERVGKIADLLQAVRDDLGFNPKIQPSKDNISASNFVAENFSDLTIRTRFISGTVPDSAALQELGYLANTQYNLAVTEDVLIRGGVCLGQIVASDDVTFGPGLVKAYLLESEFAVYPRIVVDRDLAFSLLEDDPDGLADRFLRRGDDGAYFIDYLFSATHGLFWVDEWRDGCERLSQHRDFVMSRLQKSVEKHPEKVKQKLIWLGLYHNAVIERLATDQYSSRSELRTRNLLISEDALRF
jgi:hypothetical protein